MRHDIDSKFYKAVQAVAVHIAGPCAPDSRKPCTVGDIKHATEFMLKLVGSPIVGDTAARQSPVGDAATPHHLRTIAIVFWIP